MRPEALTSACDEPSSASASDDYVDELDDAFVLTETSWSVVCKLSVGNFPHVSPCEFVLEAYRANLLISILIAVHSNSVLCTKCSRKWKETSRRIMQKLCP